MSYRLYVLGGYGFTESLLPSLFHPATAAQITEKYITRGFQGMRVDPPLEWSGPRDLTKLSKVEKQRLVDDLAEGPLLLANPFNAPWGLFARRELDPEALAPNLPPALQRHLRASWPGTSRGFGYASNGLMPGSLHPAIEPPVKVPEPPAPEKGLYQIRLRYTWPDGSGVAGAPYSVASLEDGRSGTLDANGEARVTGLFDWIVDARLMGLGIDSSIRTHRRALEATLEGTLKALREYTVDPEPTRLSLSRWPGTLGLVRFRHDMDPAAATAVSEALPEAWAATLDTSETAWRDRARAAFDGGLHESTDRALGLAPQAVPRDTFHRAYEIACYLMTDDTTLEVVQDFANAYQDLQQQPQLQVGGALVFDLALAALLHQACWQAHPGRLRVGPQWRPSLTLSSAGAKLTGLADSLRQCHLRRRHKDVKLSREGVLLEETARRPEGIALAPLATGSGLVMPSDFGEKAPSLGNLLPPLPPRPPKLHLEVGLFTDGTLNNASNTQAFDEQLERECLVPYESEAISWEECKWRMSLQMGDSYANGPSNVTKLRDLYTDDKLESEWVITYRRQVYAPGAGTKTGGDDVLYSSATGMGEAGVISQMAYAFSQLALLAKEALQDKPMDRLTLDLFGFSRGAAAARHAAHEINRGEDGLLAKALAEHGIPWPEAVEIRFVGLFDTVAAIVNPANGDLAAHNDRNYPVKLYLDPGKVGQAVHLTAAHERRRNFALNSLRNRDGSLAANFREISLPGAHSDIGGGYGNRQREEVLISAVVPVPSNRLRWPKQTLEWDSLETRRRQVEAEGWIGPYNLPVRQSDKLQAGPRDLGDKGPARLDIVTLRHDHPAPDGRMDLVLRMLREVRGEYSRVTLRLMHQLATDNGVPLDDIDTRKVESAIPDKLEPILQQLMKQITEGEDAPSLSTDHQDLLLQRYLHYSANHNDLEALVAGMPAKLRLFRHLHPHGPTLSGERRVYPQEEGQ